MIALQRNRCACFVCHVCKLFVCSIGQLPEYFRWLQRIFFGTQSGTECLRSRFCLICLIWARRCSVQRMEPVAQHAGRSVPQDLRALKYVCCVKFLADCLQRISSKCLLPLPLRPPPALHLESPTAIQTTTTDASAEAEGDVKAHLTSSSSHSDSAQLSDALPEVSLLSPSVANVNAGVSEADRGSAAVLEESMPTQRPSACKQVCVCVCVLWLLFPRYACSLTTMCFVDSCDHAKELAACLEREENLDL